MIPETRFVQAPDGVHIAFQAFGNGEIDLVWITGWTGNLEVMLEHPLVAKFYEELATSSRVIRTDRRGMGLSERGVRLPDLETQASDLLAVLDAVGSDRAVIAGSGFGGATAAMFAGTYPHRTRGVILWAASARYLAASDYPWGSSPDDMARERDDIERGWGSEEFAKTFLLEDSPSLADDAMSVRWYAKIMRHWVSPGAASDLIRILSETDIRQILPSIQAPALVGEREFDHSEMEYLASLIPSARILVLPGPDAMPWGHEQQPLIHAIREFLGVKEHRPELDRALLTVLFTDIVGSTERAAELGDHLYRQLISEHHDLVRGVLNEFGGREIETAGDSFLATFEGPARAVRCAEEIVRVVRGLGLEIRAGCHTGEVEVVGDGIRGIAVHIGARVAAMARSSEVLVSSTVKDLVAGSGLEFEARGGHELKGVPGEWRIYALVTS